MTEELIHFFSTEKLESLLFIMVAAAIDLSVSPS
jgi:hypothetical protein